MATYNRLEAEFPGKQNREFSGGNTDRRILKWESSNVCIQPKSGRFELEAWTSQNDPKQTSRGHQREALRGVREVRCGALQRLCDANQDGDAMPKVTSPPSS